MATATSDHGKRSMSEVKSSSSNSKNEEDKSMQARWYAEKQPCMCGCRAAGATRSCACCSCVPLCEDSKKVSVEVAVAIQVRVNSGPPTGQVANAVALICLIPANGSDGLSLASTSVHFKEAGGKSYVSLALSGSVAAVYCYLLYLAHCIAY